MVRITYSSKYAMNIASEYWQNTTITHGSMNESQFDFYYKKILNIMNANVNESILDYGGGNGEIAYRFKQDGFNIKHCDLSKEMVLNASEKYHLESCTCEMLDKSHYDKILFHNAFFYVHPLLVEKLLEKIHDVLAIEGKLYITDTPDFDKREKLELNKLQLFFTSLFPIYQADLSGFYIKDKKLKK